MPPLSGSRLPRVVARVITGSTNLCGLPRLLVDEGGRPSWVPWSATGATGVVGSQGAGGAAGESGYASAGSVGTAGPAREVGAQGPSGPMGAQGRVGALGRWTSYRDFTFPYSGTEVPPSEMPTVTEIASYMAQNPSLQLGIDGAGNQNLSEPRADSVRSALINAGVPASKIQVGAFGDPQLTRDHRVAVMLGSTM